MKDAFSQLEQFKYDINLLQIEKEQAQNLFKYAKQKYDMIQNSLDHAKLASRERKSKADSRKDGKSGEINKEEFQIEFNKAEEVVKSISAAGQAKGCGKAAAGLASNGFNRLSQCVYGQTQSSRINNIQHQS